MAISVGASIASAVATLVDILFRVCESVAASAVLRLLPNRGL